MSEQEKEELSVEDKEINAAIDAAFPDDVEVKEPEAKADETEGGSKETEGETEQTPSEKSLEAPEHWSDADKEIFGAVEPEAQEWLLGKAKAIEVDAEEKWQKAGSLKRENEQLFETAEAIRKIAKPLVDRYATEGVSELDAHRRVNAWFAGVSHPDPNIRLATVKDLLTHMRVRPQDLMEAVEEDDGLTDPQVVQLKQELAQMRNHLNQSAQQQNMSRQQFDQQRAQQAREAADKEFGDFKADKDESGSLKHPHIDNQEVQSLMGGLLAADSTLTLEDVYSTAVKQRGLDTESTAAKIRKAKKAASGVRSTGGSVDLDKLSDHDLISHLYDESAKSA